MQVLVIGTRDTTAAGLDSVALLIGAAGCDPEFPSPHQFVEIRRIPANINDPEFVAAVPAAFSEDMEERP